MEDSRVSDTSSVDSWERAAGVAALSKSILERIFPTVFSQLFMEPYGVGQRCKLLTILTKRPAILFLKPVFCYGLFACCQQDLQEVSIIFTQPVRYMYKMQGCDCCTDAQTQNFFNDCHYFLEESLNRGARPENMSMINHHFPTFPLATKLSFSFDFCFGVIKKWIRVFQQKSLQVRELVEDVFPIFSHTSSVNSNANSLSHCCLTWSVV